MQKNYVREIKSWKAPSTEIKQTKTSAMKRFVRYSTFIKTMVEQYNETILLLHSSIKYQLPKQTNTAGVIIFRFKRFIQLNDFFSSSSSSISLSCMLLLYLLQKYVDILSYSGIQLAFENVITLYSTFQHIEFHTMTIHSKNKYKTTVCASLPWFIFESLLFHYVVLEDFLGKQSDRK